MSYSNETLHSMVAVRSVPCHPISFITDSPLQALALHSGRMADGTCGHSLLICFFLSEPRSMHQICTVEMFMRIVTYVGHAKWNKVNIMDSLQTRIYSDSKVCNLSSFRFQVGQHALRESNCDPPAFSHKMHCVDKFSHESSFSYP